LSEIEVLVKKRGGVIYVIYQISYKIESKKGRQKFWAVKWKFFPKNGSFENFGPPKSPPMFRSTVKFFLPRITYFR